MAEGKIDIYSFGDSKLTVPAQEKTCNILVDSPLKGYAGCPQAVRKQSTVRMYEVRDNSNNTRMLLFKSQGCPSLNLFVAGKCHLRVTF